MRDDARQEVSMIIFPLCLARSLHNLPFKEHSMSYRYLNEDAIDDELRCVICNDPFQSPVNCIDRWYRQQTSCPFCREKGYLFVPVITRILLNQLNRLL